MNIAQIILVAGLVIYMIIRRFAGRPLQARTLLLPVALTAWGLYQLRQDHVSALDAGFLLVSAIVGLAAGAARGATIEIYRRDGHLWQRYRPVTLAVWVATILLRLGLDASGHVAGVSLNSTGTLVATLGASLIAETLVVSARAARTGIPYAPGRRDPRSRDSEHRGSRPSYR